MLFRLKVSLLVLCLLPLTGCTIAALKGAEMLFGEEEKETVVDCHKPKLDCEKFEYKDFKYGRLVDLLADYKRTGRALDDCKESAEALDEAFDKCMDK